MEARRRPARASAAGVDAAVRAHQGRGASNALGRRASSQEVSSQATTSQSANADDDPDEPIAEYSDEDQDPSPRGLVASQLAGSQSTSSSSRGTARAPGTTSSSSSSGSRAAPAPSTTTTTTTTAASLPWTIDETRTSATFGNLHMFTPPVTYVDPTPNETTARLSEIAIVKWNLNRVMRARNLSPTSDTDILVYFLLEPARKLVELCADAFYRETREPLTIVLVISLFFARFLAGTYGISVTALFADAKRKVPHYVHPEWMGALTPEHFRGLRAAMTAVEGAVPQGADYKPVYKTSGLVREVFAAADQAGAALFALEPGLDANGAGLDFNFDDHHASGAGANMSLAGVARSNIVKKRAPFGFWIDTFMSSFRVVVGSFVQTKESDKAGRVEVLERFLLKTGRFDLHGCRFVCDRDYKDILEFIASKRGTYIATIIRGNNFNKDVGVTFDALPANTNTEFKNWVFQIPTKGPREVFHVMHEMPGGGVRYYVCVREFDDKVCLIATNRQDILGQMVLFRRGSRSRAQPRSSQDVATANENDSEDVPVIGGDGVGDEGDDEVDDASAAATEPPLATNDADNVGADETTTIAARLLAAETNVNLRLSPGIDRADLDGLLGVFQQNLAASEVIANRVDSLRVAIRQAGQAR